MRTLHLLPYAEMEGLLTMVLDLALPESAPAEPVLRIYGWQPGTISLGRFQQPDPSLLAALAPVPVTRRSSGGGAILHDGELTYALVAPVAWFQQPHGPMFQTSDQA